MYQPPYLRNAFGKRIILRVYDSCNRSNVLLPLSAMAAAYGQSVARVKLPSAERTVTESKTETEAGDERVLAARAIVALRGLDRDVLVYHSLGQFEENGKLARVSFETFKNDLREVSAEVDQLLSRLPQGKSKIEIANAIASYRDGAFWWERIYQPRVVHVSALSYNEINRAPADAALLATVPYTVAIHWLQAAKYLKRAEQLQNRALAPGPYARGALESAHY